MTCLYIHFTHPNDFLHGSQFYFKNCPHYLPFIWGTINDCGIANMLCNLRRVLLPPKNAKLSKMAKTLNFMRCLAFNDQFDKYCVLKGKSSIKTVFFVIWMALHQLFKISRIACYPHWDQQKEGNGDCSPYIRF